MGQYHSVINLDKQAGYSPRSIGAHNKLMEQGHSTLPCATLLLLLSDPNGWGGERIAIVGDYAEDSDLDDAPFPASELWERLYLSHGLRNVGWLARKTLVDAGMATFDTRNMYVQKMNGEVRTVRLYEPTLRHPLDPMDAPAVTVVNHDKRQQLTPELLGDAATLFAIAMDCIGGGTGTALTVLLGASCKGGRRGGGDISSTSHLVGSWAGDCISVLPRTQIDTDLVDITSAIRAVLVDADEGRYVEHNGTVDRLDLDGTLVQERA